MPLNASVTSNINSGPADASGCAAPSSDPSGRWRSGLPGRVHLLGAGGAGLSGAGLHLLAQGHQVSGHDLVPSDFLDDLERAGATVGVGPSQAQDLPPDTEVLVHSAAVPPEDPQRREARRRGLPALLYAELLARLASPRHTLAVAGTHGKTTTSWMLFHALRGAGLRPGALIGGRHRGLEASAVAPTEGTEPVVLEACEYDRTFLRLHPFGAIITNVEADHLDIYGSFEAVVEAFEVFASQVHSDGLLVLGPEVPASIRDAASCEVWQVGQELQLELGNEEASTPGLPLGRLTGPGFAVNWRLSVPGQFNAHNAAVALALAAGQVGTRRQGNRTRLSSRPVKI